MKVPQRVRHILLNTPVVWSIWSITVHLLFQVFKDFFYLVLELRLPSGRGKSSPEALPTWAQKSVRPCCELPNFMYLVLKPDFTPRA